MLVVLLRGFVGWFAITALSAAAHHHPRCHVERVPFTYADGSQTIWTIRICNAGAPDAGETSDR